LGITYAARRPLSIRGSTGGGGVVPPFTPLDHESLPLDGEAFSSSMPKDLRRCACELSFFGGTAKILFLSLFDDACRAKQKYEGKMAGRSALFNTGSMARSQDVPERSMASRLKATDRVVVVVARISI